MTVKTVDIDPCYLTNVTYVTAETSLIDACSQAKSDVALNLLRQKCPITSEALRVSIRNKLSDVTFEILRQLDTLAYEKKCQIADEQDEEGNTALTTACEVEWDEMAAYLVLNCGVDVFTPVCDGGNLFHLAAAAGHTQLLEALLTRLSKESILIATEATDDEGYTPLLSACCNGEYKAAHLLLPWSNPYAITKNGESALALAQDTDSVTLLQLLQGALANSEECRVADVRAFGLLHCDLDEVNLCRKGAQKLPSYLNYYPVRRDGSCLFRAIAAGLFYAVSKDSALREQLKKQINSLSKKLLLSQELQDDLADIKKIINLFQTTATPSPNEWLEFMQMTMISDFMVSCMRTLAVTYTEQTEFKDFIQKADGESNEQYFSSMKKTSVFGTHVELDALVHALQLHIHVIDLEAIAQGAKGTEEHFIHHCEDAPLATFSLIYSTTPAHYDLAFFTL
jgi:hypothetical protein